jgi:peptidoglycan/xylan/chitin deacetylase (PgdA/CDA1 family)
MRPADRQPRRPSWSKASVLQLLRRLAFVACLLLTVGSLASLGVAQGPPPGHGKPTRGPTQPPTPTASGSNATPTVTAAATATQPSASPVTSTPTATPRLTNTPMPVATSTATSTATPSPTPATRSSPSGSYGIYDEGLRSGWVSWSWDSSINFADTARPYAGIRDLLWRPTAAWGGLYLHTDTAVNTTGYSVLTFALQSTQSGSALSVHAYDATSTALPAKLSLSAYGGAPPVGTYRVYSIPLADLQASNRLITGIVLQDASGAPSYTIYADAVALSSSAVESLPPPPTPTPSGTAAHLSFTFDDGTTSQFSNARPLLQRYGMSGTFYIISGSVGLNSWYMTANQVRELANGGAEIGSHTVTHPHLSQVSSTDAMYELADSKRYLEGLVGKSVEQFASPFGDYNAAVLDQIRQYYRSHRTANPGLNAPSSLDQYQLLTRWVGSTTTDGDVAAWIQEAQTSKSWLILGYHEISDTDSTAVPVWMFERQLIAVRNSGTPVVTVGAGLDRLGR